MILLRVAHDSAVEKNKQKNAKVSKQTVVAISRKQFINMSGQNAD